MMATLAMLQERYGGVENYVREHCRLSDDDVAIIKRNLVHEHTQHAMS